MRRLRGTTNTIRIIGITKRDQVISRLEDTMCTCQAKSMTGLSRGQKWSFLHVVDQYKGPYRGKNFSSQCGGTKWDDRRYRYADLADIEAANANW